MGFLVCDILGVCERDDWVWGQGADVGESVFVHGVSGADQ